MKFIYFLIIGLVLFNGVLILTSSIFNTGFESSATNVSDTFGGYALTNSTSVLDIMFSDSTMGAWGAFSAIDIIGVIGAILLKNYVIAAVALFIGVVTALYLGVSSVMFNLSNNNVYLNILITLIGIVIGILVIYNVIEMFSGTAGDI